MCIEAVEVFPWQLKHVPDNFKTQDKCNEVVHGDPYLLQYVPYYLRTQETCDKAVRDDFSSLQFVLDWFVVRKWVDMWHDDYCDDDGDQWDDDDNEDKFLEWYDGYKKRKAQKAKIREELLPIVWHPSRWWDWCVPEDETRQTEKL